MTCQFSMLQTCSILHMILIMRLNFSNFLFIYYNLNCKTINNSCIICLNLKIYEITFHGLEDPWVTNKQPSLIDWCVCLQKYISKFNDALFKAKLLSWWAKGCSMCKVDLDHNIMAQQAPINEMWIIRKSDIGPR